MTKSELLSEIDRVSKQIKDLTVGKQKNEHKKEVYALQRERTSLLDELNRVDLEERSGGLEPGF